jgi:LmbE family N-acetylglucosaminyl deacetylase
MNILAFFAHPDDETMLCGGILALLARQGASVYLLCATRGEGGETGEPPLCSLAELGAVRAAELACAARALGIASLTFMDYIDPRVGQNQELYPFEATPQELAARLGRYLAEWKIEALITHGANGEYGHPAHLLIHQAAGLAVVAAGGRAPLWYCVQAAFDQHPRSRLMNKDQPAHLVLDITPVLEQKVQAALCHRTQHALFVRRPSQEAGRPLSVPETIVKVESLHRAWPPVEGAPGDALAALLLQSGCARDPGLLKP